MALPPDNDNDLDGMTERQLVEELQRCCTVSVRVIVRQAACIRRLEAKGVDLSAFKVGMVQFVFLVAYGKLLPEAVVRFMGSKRLLKALVSLSPEEQRRLSEPEARLPVVVVAPGGGYTTRMVAPADMGSEQLAQVFGDTGIRSEAQQAAFLDGQGVKERKRKRHDEYEGIGLDRVRVMLNFKRGWLSAEVVERALRELRRK